MSEGSEERGSILPGLAASFSDRFPRAPSGLAAILHDRNRAIAAAKTNEQSIIMIFREMSLIAAISVTTNIRILLRAVMFLIG